MSIMVQSMASKVNDVLDAGPSPGGSTKGSRLSGRSGRRAQAAGGRGPGRLWTVRMKELGGAEAARHGGNRNAVGASVDWARRAGGTEDLGGWVAKGAADFSDVTGDQAVDVAAAGLARG
jgi:hypothetical protein